MLDDYIDRFYNPLRKRFAFITANNFEKAKEKAVDDEKEGDERTDNDDDLEDDEVDDKGKNVRYLCEGARYTFTFSGTSGITAAGKTVTTYRLRLVKRVRFILN